MHNTGTVDITDLASVSSAYGTDDPYWNTGYPGPLKIYHGFPLPAIGSDPNVVDASEMATVSIYFGHTLTGSYPPSSLTGLDPVIDPFWQNG